MSLSRRHFLGTGAAALAAIPAGAMLPAVKTVFDPVFEELVTLYCGIPIRTVQSLDVLYGAMKLHWDDRLGMVVDPIPSSALLKP